VSIPADLFEQAMQLDAEARVELAERLLDSVQHDRSEPDATWEASWAAEVEERARDVEQGRAALHSREEFEAQVRESIARARE
jgi:putative addiction module component (TIGR02574 family)